MAERRESFGMLCAVFANCNAFGDGKARSPKDFYPDFDEEPTRQTPEQQEAMLRAFFARFKKKN